MERRARILTLVIGLFGLSFAALLTRTSFRGDVVADRTETDRLAVRAGRQNVGGREALRDIRLGVVREIRLRFAVDEPHWVIEVDMQ